jgi:hypothetical protein
MADKVVAASLYLKSRMMGDMKQASLKLNSGNAIEQTSAGPVLKVGAKTGTLSSTCLVVRGRDLYATVRSAWENNEIVQVIMGTIGTKAEQANCIINSLDVTTESASGDLTLAIEFDIMGVPTAV